MLSWRDRMCGSISVAAPSASMNQDTLNKFMKPTEEISCGGGFFPPARNLANQATTPNQSFVLPTEAYSILVLKSDGNAVIYSDEAPRAEDEDLLMPTQSNDDDDDEGSEE